MRLSRIAGAAVLVAVFTGVAAPAQAQIKLTGITNLQGVSYINGVLEIASATVEGTLGGLPFTTTITNFVLSPAQAGSGSCSVLDLELNPISISLFGLHVDTSSICLTITAHRGQGILGNLLCSLAGSGGVLQTVTNILNSPQFLSGLSTILNRALGQAQNAPAGGTSVCSGDCTVLDLVLGPLTLNLLGVTVNLDNCSGGPVEVCVSATASEGLLGELLCGLAGGGPLNMTLQELLGIIEGLISSLGLG